MAIVHDIAEGAEPLCYFLFLMLYKFCFPFLPFIKAL